MTSPVIGLLTSSQVIQRHPLNPILDAEKVPYPTSLVFNAGVTKFNGMYVMVFRNIARMVSIERLIRSLVLK